MSRVHTVQAGDTMQRIALRFGFRHWERIYAHPNNAELRRRRADPNILAVGDEVFIPDLEARWEPCDTGREHVFVVHRATTMLDLRLEGFGREPIVGWPWELELAGVVHEGVVRASGRIQVEVDPTTTDGVLRLWAAPTRDGRPIELRLRLGFLEPVETDGGVLARLRNLGWYDGSQRIGLDHPAILAALSRFRRSQGHDDEETDRPIDEPTRRALKDAHRC